MAKPEIKKSAPKVAPKVAPSAPVEKKTRERQTVLLKVTASKLHDLIGDQEIGVSRKELSNLITKGARDAALKAAGL